MLKVRQRYSHTWSLLLLIMAVACSGEEQTKMTVSNDETVVSDLLPIDVPALPKPYLNGLTRRYLNSWSNFQDFLKVMDLSPALRSYLVGGADQSKMLVLNNTYQGLLYKVESLNDRLHKLIKSPRFSSNSTLKSVKSRVALLHTYVLRLRVAMISDPELTDLDIVNLVSDVYTAYGYLIDDIIRNNNRRYTKYDLDIITMPR